MPTGPPCAGQDQAKQWRLGAFLAAALSCCLPTTQGLSPQSIPLSIRGKEYPHPSRAVKVPQGLRP